MDLAGRQQNAEIYRNEGDPISIFGRSAKTTPFTRDMLKAPAMTHQYANNANMFKPDQQCIDVQIIQATRARTEMCQHKY